MIFDKKNDILLVLVLVDLKCNLVQLLWLMLLDLNINTESWRLDVDGSSLLCFC